MDTLNKHRFVIALLSGIGALLLVIHFAALSQAIPLRPVAPVMMSAAHITIEAPQLASEFSASDEYARNRGYRDWNEYVATQSRANARSTRHGR